MRYGILGTTQVHAPDGQPVALGGARLRALLGALALHPGRTRTTGALTDAVWGAEPPADATGALQALVGRLRRAIGRDAVESVAGGYRLCAEPDQVDLHRFQRLAEEGARALADGDPGKAAVLLEDALALWRGPALADLPGHQAEAARLAARRLDARRDRLAAAVALGQAEQALPELAELCTGHPLDEPLQALRLRALRASGRPAEALAAYEQLRTMLADRLGADPGPELRSVHAELLTPAPSPHAPRPGIAGGPDMPRPTGRGGPGGPGGPGGTRSPGGAATTRPRRGNLRARLTSFVGREQDVASIRADLATHRLVTLLGPGGAGKTRLSQEAAEAAADAWPDGVWFAELAPLEDEDSVPEAVITALGARETVVRGTAEGLRVAADTTAHDPLARLAEHCAQRRMLLVLDNCEHLVTAAARLAETLLAHCPGVTVLATSREPLALPGELVRPVEPLPDPVALRLLADRGATARPGFRIEDDPAACAEICRRLDGLPLAIELAAARLRMLTPRGLADRLDDRFRLLTSGSRTVLPRQQTLRAVVDWSWDLLDEPERAVLRRLSVFSGGCDLPAAEAVCADPESVPAPEVAVVVGSLVDKSLMVAAPDDRGEMRYRLLETVGEYAGERLDEAGERPEVERRHLVHYRELARTADPLLRGPQQRHWVDRLEREQDNMRAALRHAVAAGDEHEALCLVLSLNWFWTLRARLADNRIWSEAVAQMGPDPFQEPVEIAPPLTERCIDAPPPMRPELFQEARRQVRLIVISTAESDMRVFNSPEMQARLRAVLSVYRHRPPQTLRTPGMLWIYARLLTSDFALLFDDLDRAVALSRELGYEWELAYHLQQRAKVGNEWPGRAEQARRDADESLEIFRRTGDAWGVAEALAGRGESRERLGEFEAAAEDYREAMDSARAVGAITQVALMRSRLAEMLMEAGIIDAAENERMLRQAKDEAEGGVPDVDFLIRLTLAIRVARAGRLAEGRELLLELLAEFKHRSIRLFQGMMLGLLSWLDVLGGRPEEALPRVRQALEMLDDPMSAFVAVKLPVMQLMHAAYAHAHLDGEEHALAAARLLGASAVLRVGGPEEQSLEREVRQRTEAGARAALGEEAYRRAYAEGGRLTLAEATALI